MKNLMSCKTLLLISLLVPGYARTNNCIEQLEREHRSFFVDFLGDKDWTRDSFFDLSTIHQAMKTIQREVAEGDFKRAWNRCINLKKYITDGLDYQRRDGLGIYSETLKDHIRVFETLRVPYLENGDDPPRLDAELKPKADEALHILQLLTTNLSKSRSNSQEQTELWVSILVVWRDLSLSLIDHLTQKYYQQK